MTTWTTDRLFNRERFEAWLAEQPGERAFDYTDCQQCALCHFTRETSSAPLFTVSFDTFHLQPEFMNPIPLPTWAVAMLREAREQHCSESLKISHMRDAYHKLFNIDVMEAHAPVTLTPQPERV